MAAAALPSPTKQLEDAITRGSLDNVKKAINAGANIKGTYTTETNGIQHEEPLFLLAVSKGNMEIIKLLAKEYKKRKDANELLSTRSGRATHLGSPKKGGRRTIKRKTKRTKRYSRRR